MGILGDLKNKIEGPAITATPDEVFDFLTNEGYQSLQASASGNSGAVGILASAVTDSARDIKIESSDANNKIIRYSYKVGPEIFANKLEIKILSANDYQASWLKFESSMGGNRTGNNYESPSQQLISKIRNIAGQRFGTTKLLHVDKADNKLF